MMEITYAQFATFMEAYGTPTVITLVYGVNRLWAAVERWLDKSRLEAERLRQEAHDLREERINRTENALALCQQGHEESSKTLRKFEGELGDLRARLDVQEELKAVVERVVEVFRGPEGT